MKSIKTSRRIKIISLGDAAVGKSVLIKRFCEKRFEKRYFATIGVDYGSIVADDHTSYESLKACSGHVDFYDLSGDDDFAEVRNEFYQNADAMFLVFDVTSQSSFEKLPTWLDEIRCNGVGIDVPIVLCANKIDAFPKLVSEKQISDFAQKHKLRHYHTSAAKGIGVGEMFMSLFQDAFAQTSKLFNRMN